MTFVMLAIERLSWAFSCQSTSPVAGLKMIAAAARTSGTRSPCSSVLYRGVIASFNDRNACIRWNSRLRAAVLARARRAFLAFDADAEYAGRGARRGVARRTDVTEDAAVDFLRPI